MTNNPGPNVVPSDHCSVQKMICVKTLYVLRKLDFTTPVVLLLSNMVCIPKLTVITLFIAEINRDKCSLLKNLKLNSYSPTHYP